MISFDKLPVCYEGNKIYDIAYSTDFEGLKDFYDSYNPDHTKKLCIVSDTKVASFYLDAILDVSENHFSKVVSYTFPEGEQSKNLDTVRNLYVKLIEEHFDRNDVLLALGGGVTGDMCGFTAATYLRGIDFIQVPTSLLADVDSSIGGKTGVDFEQYKNMVGAFHMPKLVYINISTLKSLDIRQFYSGMGEVVKSALIKKPDFYEWLETSIDKKCISSVDEAFSDDSLLHIISECNKMKKEVVENDPHEKTGERALLNFGHTLGHALEKYMNFELLHGECVSIGCILATMISRDKKILSQEKADRVISHIRNYYNLPKLPEDIDIDKIVEFTHNDKKASGNIVKFILLRDIGDAFVSKEVTDIDKRKAFEEYLRVYNEG